MALFPRDMSRFPSESTLPVAPAAVPLSRPPRVVPQYHRRVPSLPVVYPLSPSRTKVAVYNVSTSVESPSSVQQVERRLNGASNRRSRLSRLLALIDEHAPSQPPDLPCPPVPTTPRSTTQRSPPRRSSSSTADRRPSAHSKSYSLPPLMSPPPSCPLPPVPGHSPASSTTSIDFPRFSLNHPSTELSSSHARRLHSKSMSVVGQQSDVKRNRQAGEWSGAFGGHDVDLKTNWSREKSQLWEWEESDGPETSACRRK